MDKGHRNTQPARKRKIPRQSEETNPRFISQQATILALSQAAGRCQFIPKIPQARNRVPVVTESFFIQMNSGYIYSTRHRIVGDQKSQLLLGHEYTEVNFSQRPIFFPGLRFLNEPENRQISDLQSKISPRSLFRTSMSKIILIKFITFQRGNTNQNKITFILAS